MVARSSGYFRRLFNGYQGVVQGDPLSLTIFNVVVDAFIHHWVTLVTPTEVGTGGLGLTIIDLAAYFYTNNGLVAPTHPVRLHRAFDILTRIFDRVSLRINTGKTFSMVCQTCHAPDGMSG